MYSMNNFTMQVLCKKMLILKRNPVFYYKRNDRSGNAIGTINIAQNNAQFPRKYLLQATSYNAYL